MFQNDITNFLWPVLQYLKPQYVTATTPPVVCSPPLFIHSRKQIETSPSPNERLYRQFRRGGDFFCGTQEKNKNCDDAADFLFLHLYLLYISSTLNDVIGLRRQSLNLEVFFSPEATIPLHPSRSNHIIRLRHQSVFPVFWCRSTVSPQRSRIRTSESSQHTQSPGDFVEANSQNSGTIVVK